MSFGHHEPDPKSVSPKIVPADLQAWHQGFLNLRSSVVPCPGLTIQSWASVPETCIEFLDRWADKAAGLGWTTLDRWGKHSEVGQIRSDYRGGIVISGDKVAAVTGTWITSTSKACYRDKPDRPTGAVRICMSRRWI